MQESKESFHESLDDRLAKLLLEEEALSHFVLIHDGKFIHLTFPFAALFGRAPREMLGCEVIRFIAESEHTSFLEELSTLTTGVTARLRMTAVAKEWSNPLDITVKAKLLNGLMYYVVFSWRESLSRNASAKPTLELDGRFQAAFHYAAVGMALLNFTGRFMDVNHAMCDMLGYSRQELLQIPFRACMVEEDYREYMSQCTRIVNHEIPAYQTELRCRRLNGELVWGQLNVTMVRDSQGQPVYFIVQLQNIAGRKEAEELLRKSDKLSVVGRLAAGVAHEVRNPLTVLKGFAQMLNSADRKNSHYYQLMLSEVDRIESMLGEFLLLARPQETRFITANLLPLLQDVITLMETKAVMNKVLIMPVLSDHMPDIECDVNQLKQVFVNMIQNAIEAMPQGGYVTVEAGMHTPDTVFVRIIDQGCGIPDGQLEQLGTPFFSNKEKGTGLGLMVSYNIIEKHKGQVLVTSRLNEGTTFDIRLPVSQNGYVEVKRLPEERD